MIHRSQFSLKTMLWLIAVAAAFFAGWEGHRRKEERAYQRAWKGGREMGITPPLREKLMESAARNRGILAAQACEIRERIKKTEAQLEELKRDLKKTRRAAR